MSEQDPKRLLEGGGSESAGDLRSLLETGKSEMPTDAQMAMLAAKIGVIGGLGGAGAAGAMGGGGAGAGAGGAGAGAGAGGALGAASSGMTGGLALKVIGAVALAGVVGAAAVGISQRTVETATPVGLVAAEAHDAGAGANPNANVSANASANASAELEPTVDAGGKRNGARAAASSVASAEVRDEGPAAEVKLLERAQDALRSRPAEALALCNDHAQRFPSGMFVQEREVIAVGALVKLGNTDEARRRTDRFKARFPGSSHARRLDALLAGGDRRAP